MSRKRFKLISCEVFVREMCHAIAQSTHQVDVEFLPKGLHDLGRERMVAHLEEIVARVDESLYDAILLGYGLCNNGIVGLRARMIPLVVPRAHDCITVFFGSKERYLDYFTNNPGTYFLTSGWIERGNARGEIAQLSIQSRSGMNATYEELVEKYGEDNAEFLWEELVNHARRYGRYTYIHMGVEPDGSFEEEAKARASEKGWKFERVEGSLSLIHRLVNGEWNPEDFLVVPPGKRLIARYDEGIIAAGEDG